MMNAMMTTTPALRVAPVASVKMTKKTSSAFLSGGSASFANSNRRSTPRGLFPSAAARNPLVIASSSGKTDKTSKKKDGVVDTGRLALLATVASHPVIFGCQEAFAKGGEYGLYEGRSMALIHPIFLGGMWFASVYAGYLGWQWRRVRTTGDEITSLKATMPAAAADAATVDLTPTQKETESKIAELTATRKELIAGGFKDKHSNAGYFLLAFGTMLAVEGGMNTYLRTGKLFPGPHLYAGMGIVCLWAAAAGLVPEMQKGNNTARNVHIALNAVNVALFTWQIPTGLEIVGKVFQFTSWP